MILLSAQDLAKSYGSRTLFTGLNFGIEEKERVGFVGPNGAGKTTLLKILAGVVEADLGQVTRKRGLRIGYLEQTPTFRTGATILETLLERAEDPHESQLQALGLLAQMELYQFGSDFEVERLSGGWKKRVALARELVPEPELLLLDEPTNHLDISGVLWLEDFLRSTPLSLLMVTHDRLFLQRVANRIMDLDPRNPNYLLSVKGDYAQYLESKEQELAALKRHEQVEANRLRRETEWLRRGALARHTKQSARKESAAELKETVEQLRAKNQQRVVDIEFAEAGHSPKKLIEALAVSKSYGERELFAGLDLLITPKTRLGLLGDNGSGKSTLIRVLLGLEKPDSGKVQHADKLEVAYFEQSRETLNHSLSVLKNICPEGDYVFYQGQSVHVRSYLDRFFFSGPKVDLPVAKLSGGEQARLRLAQLMLKRCQVLVLDEPTNDLDSDTLDSLSESLKQFNGAVILVTHDRYFLDSVVTQILSFPDMGKFAGYFQWENWFREQKGSAPASRKKASAENNPPGEEGQASAARGPTKLSYKEKFELENMEATIAKLEEELAAVTAESIRPEVLADHQKLHEVHQRLARLHAALEEKFARWSELDAKSK